MISRRVHTAVEHALRRQAAVALIGPRQVGKTTLALDIGQSRRALYLDLESSTDRAKLAEPELFHRQFEERLVILDVEDFPIMRHWYLVHRSEKRLQPISQAFKDFVLKEGKNLIPALNFIT